MSVEACSPEAIEELRKKADAYDALISAFGRRTEFVIPLREPAINVTVSGIPRDVTKFEINRIVRFLWCLPAVDSPPKAAGTPTTGETEGA